jgi:ATP-dependent RNA helicase DOB1
MVLEDDLKKMKRLLRRLGYISKDEIIEMKGKVACEISACDEIILTEILMSGLFQETTPHEAVALLTVLVFDENNANADKFVIKNDRLAKFFAKILEQAKKVYLVY